MKYLFGFIFLLLGTASGHAQVEITGYIFESGNRGYISQATVTLSNEKQTEYYGQLVTDASGGYKFTVSGPGTYFLRVEKSPYFEHEEVLEIDETLGKSVFLKHEIKRNPGYIFEITLAQKDAEADTPRDALKGALVEAYNNTQKKEELVIDNLQTPEFQVDLLKGNHYTVLIRKPGFLSKRMEAFVDVEGCILCFEGIGRVTPGVSDNLTEGNSMGVLLANVEMDRYYAGKVIGLNDIYYEFGKSNITSEAADELIKVADFLKDNPNISVELGSHTDSRGGAPTNLTLSEKRAQSAVEYLVNRGGVSKERISAKGYGEMQLTNNCGDGADCTEEEHQLNRRTELKVVDIITASGYRMLRQMKADELMEEILADLDNSGQIKVGEGENLDDAIAAGGSSIVAETPSVSTTEAPKEVSQVEEKAKEQLAETTKEIPEAQASKEMPEDVKIDEEISTSAPDILQEVIATSDVEENIETFAEQELEDETPVQEQVSHEIEKIQANETSPSEIAEWIRPGGSELITSAATEAGDSKMYSPTYSGYKVVVIFSRYELPKEHIIFETYDNVDVYSTADGNKLYMLGSFYNKKEADTFMNDNLKEPYPHSYVVGFENGIRIY